MDPRSPPDAMTFDIIAVGAGAVGALVDRLTADGRWSVLLLDKERAVGVETTLVRGADHDFDRWAALGAAGWDAASVRPYFARLEAAAPPASAARPVRALTRQWIDAAVQAGVPPNPAPDRLLAEGVDVLRTSWRRALGEGSARPNLREELGARVVRIRLRDGRAVGVDYVRDGEVRTARARRGVILGAGVVNTPRLLMLSGVGPGPALRALDIETAVHAPGVGENLQCHVGVGLVASIRDTADDDDAAGAAGDRGVLDGAHQGPEAPIGRAHALVRTRAEAPAPNVQIVFSPFAFDRSEGEVRLRDEPCISQAVAVMRPASRGTVKLRAADPREAPAIDHHLFEDEDDLEQLVDGALLARRIVRQPALSAIVEQEIRPGPKAASREGLRAFVRREAHPYHLAGTCRMGQDADAVVDPALRVRGIEGLWIADASVMPTIPAGNIQATAAMIGERAADLILADLAA